jgi:hypothetical protein
MGFMLQMAVAIVCATKTITYVALMKLVVKKMMTVCQVSTAIQMLLNPSALILMSVTPPMDSSLANSFVDQTHSVSTRLAVSTVPVI